MSGGSHSDLLRERRKNKRKKRKQTLANRPTLVNTEPETNKPNVEKVDGDHGSASKNCSTTEQSATTNSEVRAKKKLRQDTDDMDPNVEKTLVTDNPKNGTLSDLLNPSHPAFNETFQKNWKSLPKRTKSQYVKRDAEIRKGLLEKVSNIKHPFPVENDDHCESPVEAYQDIAPVLEFFAKHTNGLDSYDKLSVYDPYFCAGTCVEHLTKVGFPNIYNKCEDFYKVQQAGNVPFHDVLVTNPPYSLDHVEKLLDFAFDGNKNRPFALLMPNYVVSKSYFQSLVEKHKGKTCFLYPYKRYNYWTPKGFRAKDKLQNHVSRFGVRTSPFVSFWYISTGSLNAIPADLRSFLATRKASTLVKERETSTGFCVSADEIPSAAKP